jgi:hypothetical protein
MSAIDRHDSCKNLPQWSRAQRKYLNLLIRLYSTYGQSHAVRLSIAQNRILGRDLIGGQELACLTASAEQDKTVFTWQHA